MEILERISPDFVKICCDKKGTHTIQKFIDLVNLEQEEKFFQKVLKGHVVLLSFVRILFYFFTLIRIHKAPMLFRISSSVSKKTRDSSFLTRSSKTSLTWLQTIAAFVL